mmetsp:Transcript_9778/g.44538  ORF Transcript_9778/g.44538 Transcript_9778/m.44538 type:complete len:548 (-) Transcript_9778:1339-2982(-)
MTTTTENAPANMDPVPADPEAKAEAVKDAPATDAPATDDAKEAKPAEKVPKPENPRLPKPDRVAMDRKIQDLQEAADVKQARIEELKKMIGNRRDAQKNIMSGSSGTRTRIGELNAAFQALMDERGAIRKELQAFDAARERVREQAVGMKSKLRFHTIEAVDREIAKLEETHAHTTMSLNEEKKLIAQIKDLNKSRETVREYAEAQGKISGDDGVRKSIIDRLRAKDDAITAVKSEQNGFRGELNAAKEEGDKAFSDVPKLQEERNACYEVIKARREEIRALRAEFKKAEDAHWNREREWRGYLKQEKQKQWEASQEERKARDEARKQWERENAPEPFEAEVTAADQLTAYLAKWDPLGAKAGAEKAAADAKEAEEKKNAAFAGLQMMNKKMKDEEDDDLFSLSGTSKGKKAKKKGKAESAGPAGPNPNERLNISFDAYQHFAKLSLAAPGTVGEVPAMLISLKEKKDLFLEKRKVKKERIAAGLEDEDEAAKKEASKEKKDGGNKGGKGGKGKGKGKGKGSKKGPCAVKLEVEGDAVVVVIEVADE